MPTHPSFVAILRWTARVIGALIILLIAALAVGAWQTHCISQWW